LNLCYRLLTAQPEVLDLIDRKQLPFKKPPAYIRVRLYTYRFTGITFYLFFKSFNFFDIN
jgi:hypothetical protein